MRILFMGTPEFARDQLRALCESRETHGFTIVGAVSQPDRPKGRGYQMIPTPVKVYAQEMGVDVYQPESLRDAAFETLLAALDPELIVVAAYGRILPESVLSYPKRGCINVHGSLLPAYRGAAPIQRAVMDGLRETGNTIMYMEKGLDTGDIILQSRVAIGEDESFGSLYARMGADGAQLLIRAIEQIEAGTAVRIKQDDACATYAAKIEKTEGALSFAESAAALHDRIRALSPAPLAYAGLLRADGGERASLLKIAASTVVEREGVHGEAGEVLSVDAKRGVFCVACGAGVLGVTEVTPEGKGRMNAGDFIRGRKIAPGDRLTVYQK